MVTSQFLYRDGMGWGLCLARGSWNDECDHIPGGQGSVLLHSSRPTCSFLNPPPQLLPSQKEVLHHLVPGNPPELCSAETEKASLGQFSSARLGQKHWPILQRTWK